MARLRGPYISYVALAVLLGLAGSILWGLAKGWGL